MEGLTFDQVSTIGDRRKHVVFASNTETKLAVNVEFSVVSDGSEQFGSKHIRVMIVRLAYSGVNPGLPDRIIYAHGVRGLTKWIVPLCTQDCSITDLTPVLEPDLVPKFSAFLRRLANQMCIEGKFLLSESALTHLITDGVEAAWPTQSFKPLYNFPD